MSSHDYKRRWTDEGTPTDEQNEDIVISEKSRYVPKKLVSLGVYNIHYNRESGDENN